MWAMLSRAGQGRPTCSGSTPAPHPLSLDADNPRRGENPAAFAMVHRQEKKTKAEADGLLYSSRAIDRDCRRWQIFFTPWSIRPGGLRDADLEVITGALSTLSY